MILGVDISTAKIGIAVIDKDKKLVYCDVIKYTKDSLEERAINFFMYALDNIKNKYEITEVRVEEPLTLFRGGKTTANTMAKLQRFNGMLSVLLFKKFGMVPVMVGARSARATCGIKIPKKTNTKPYIIKWAEKTYPNDFSYTLTPKGNPKPGTDDKADAIVIAYSYF